MNARRIGSAGLLIVLLALFGAALVGLAGCAAPGQAPTEPGGVVTPTAVQVDDLAQRVDPAALADAPLVTIEELLAAPGEFLSQFIQIQGINVGAFGRPDCSPWVGPPSQWGLANQQAVYENHVRVNTPLIVPIQNTFGNAIDIRSDTCGNTIQNSWGRQTAIWGWVRLYEGPVGCVGYLVIDETEVPQTMQPERVWYIEAVKLQFLESIDVPLSPGLPTCDPATRPPTIERPTDTPRPTSTPAMTLTPYATPTP